METCERCNGNCDSGELVQGICPECAEEIKMWIHAKRDGQAPVLSLQAISDGSGRRWK